MFYECYFPASHLKKLQSSFAFQFLITSVNLELICINLIMRNHTAVDSVETSITTFGGNTEIAKDVL